MPTKTHPFHRTYKKLLVAAAIGLVSAVIMTALGQVKFAPLVAWDVAAVVYIVWVWAVTRRMNGVATKRHAEQEDPGRTGADLLLLTASIVSLVAVLFLVLQSTNASGIEKVLDITIGLVSVVVSWTLVHVTYALKYARLFYGKRGGEVDFNEKNLPTYGDFAYLSFTLGMTYQVSDTNLKTKEIRAAALRHALLSYLFGTVIIATTVSTLASLSN